MTEPEAQLCIELAGRKITATGTPRGWYQELPDRLLDCSVAPVSDPHWRIHTRFESHQRLLPPTDGHDLNEVSSVSFDTDCVRFQSDWCEGQFRPGTGDELTLVVHPDARPWFGGILENALRLLMAYDALASGGVLLHSAALVRKGRATVLFGHSGAGKSTTSAMALEAGWQVISDDVNVLEPGPAGWVVRQVPFSGSLNANAPGLQPVPLDGLYRLRKASDDRLAPCSAAQAVTLLCGSAPFVNQDPYRSARLLDTLTALVRDVNTRQLYFSHSPRFLERITKESSQ